VKRDSRITFHASRFIVGEKKMLALRRIFGLIMLLIGILGVVLSIVVTSSVRQMMDNIGRGIDQALVRTTETLDTVGDTIALTKTTMGQVQTSLDTVETTSDNLGQTISETRPLLDQISAVASEDVPAGIEQFQAGIPDMAEAAAAIDTTLRTLNDFQIDTSILGVPIEYDLGINYEPEQPFDETVNQIGTSLEDIPPRLRSLRIYINVADENLDEVSQNLFEISDNLGEINSSVTDFEPLLDDYAQSVTETNDLVRQARVNTAQQVESIKNTLTLVFIWFGLTQIAPIYLGFELALNQRPRVVVEQTEVKG
jgi:uncharacterized phage infection (PIP) family protein YhgE